MSSTVPQGVQSRAANRRHELRDVNVRGILIAAGSLAVIIAALHVLAGLLLVLFNANPAPGGASLSPLAERPVTTPGPRLQVSPQQDLAEFRASERSRLSGYGWVDRKSGTISIPVDRAKELFVQQSAAPGQVAPPAVQGTQP